MRSDLWKIAPAFGLASMLAFGMAGAAAAEAPQRGGILKFVVSAEPPSFDGHRETTFALIHPIAPFYSVLIRVNPDNPASPTDFVCDLCTAMPKPTNGGKQYSFQIRKDVKFHDGSPLTAHDVVASFNKIIGHRDRHQDRGPRIEQDGGDEPDGNRGKYIADGMILFRKKLGQPGEQGGEDQQDGEQRHVSGLGPFGGSDPPQEKGG